MGEAMTTTAMDRELIVRSLQESGSTKARVCDDAACLDAVAQCGTWMRDALLSHHRVFLFGNGGSAADAQHIAAELVGRFQLQGRRGLPAISLTTDTSALTAIANDFSYDVIFARQVEALGQPGDVAIGITTSGNSPNVIKAIQKAREMGMHTAVLTGGDGGKLHGMERIRTIKISHAVYIYKASNLQGESKSGKVVVIR